MEQTEKIEKKFINGLGEQVFLEVIITNCHQFKIRLKTRRKDPRKLIPHSGEELNVFPKNTSSVKINEIRQTNLISKSIDDQYSHFNVNLDFLQFTNMDYNPIVNFSVRKSPFSSIKPKMILKATKYDDNGNSINYEPYNGEIDGSDIEIDILKK
jgi:hypothetical protein